MAVDQNWLALSAEEAIEPDRPIIDPHHHLWGRRGERYLGPELLADMRSGHTVVATVFVECMAEYRTHGPEALRPVGETEFVEAVARDIGHGVCAGIVGFADLMLGAGVDEVLAAHLKAAPDRFRGIRHAAGWDASDAIRNSHTDPPPGLLTDKTFRSGARGLAAAGLTFDAWLFHPQVPELTEFARALPDLTIVFNHFAGPLGIGPYQGRRAEIFAQWRRDVADLATCPNVVAKLGGINMPVNGFGWHKRETPPSSDDLVAATRGYYDHAIECFGPQRCMFESNFPVDKASCSYSVLWNAFKKIAAGCSESEKAALFHDTAARVYRLALKPA